MSDFEDIPIGTPVLVRFHGSDKEKKGTLLGVKYSDMDGIGGSNRPYIRFENGVEDAVWGAIVEPIKEESND